MIIDVLGEWIGSDRPSASRVSPRIERGTSVLPAMRPTGSLLWLADRRIDAVRERCARARAQRIGELQREAAAAGEEARARARDARRLNHAVRRLAARMTGEGADEPR